MLPKAAWRYLGVEVPRREPEVDPERLDGELEAVRERLARLETAERAAAAGDFVVIDYLGRLTGEGGRGGGASRSRGARPATSWSSSARGG